MLKYLKQSLTFEKSSPSYINIDPFNKLMNLQQGKNYNDFKTKQTEDNKKMRVRLNLIEGLENNEGIQGMPTMDSKTDVNYDEPLNKIIESEITELKLLEDKFKQSLSAYSSKYKDYMEDILKYTKSQHLQYTNKNIITPSGKNYYVTNYGAARLYDDKSLGKKHKSCNVPTENVSSDNIPSLGLTMGEPMKPYEPCGYEGRNVRISSDEPLMNLCSLPGTKTAQSSYYDKKNSYPASNAIDGNPKTFTHTGRGVEQWLEITLPAVKFINKVTIQNRLDCCRYRFKKVMIRIYDRSYNNVKFEKMITSADPSKQIYFYIENINVVGNLIRLIQYTDDIADNNLSVGEVQVFGHDIVNKENSKKGKKGYVDMNGMLHPYPNNDMTNTTGTCSDNITDIDELTWDRFNLSDDMHPGSLCNLGSVDVEKKAELVKLNDDLIKQSENIYSKIALLRGSMNNISNLDNIKQQELNTHIQTFEHLFKEYNTINKNKDTLEVMVSDNSMTTKSNMYQYIMWISFTIIIMLIAFRHMRR